MGKAGQILILRVFSKPELGELYPMPDWHLMADRCCREQSLGMFVCTLQKGHDGPHIAHGSKNYVCDAWIAEDEDEQS